MGPTIASPIASRSFVWGSMIVAASYGGLSAVVGEWFPFSQIPMYSELGAHDRRVQAAVPVVLVDGVRDDIRRYTDFEGPRAEDILQDRRCRANGECRGFPVSDPRDQDLSDWVRQHRHPADEPTLGAHRAAVQVGYILISSLPDGGYHQSYVAVWDGSARPVER